MADMNTEANSIECVIFKGAKKADTYLYVTSADALDDVPAPLLTSMGELTHVMDLVLSPERPLAQEDVNTVIDNLRTQGFHLQMPPRPEILNPRQNAVQGSEE